MSRPQGPFSNTAFNSLPIELNKAIVHYLDNDKDIATYRLICRSTNDAIDADRQSFWRAKFREKYDFLEGTPNNQLRRMYQRRSKLLRCGTKYGFFRGHGKTEARVVKMLKDLIIESFYGATETDEHGRFYCRNHAHLIQFILESRLLNNDRRPPIVRRGEPAHVDETLAAVKLICSQFIFNLPGIEHNIFAFDESQFAVYQSTTEAPIFLDNYEKVNLEWVLHSMNFFRHHMMNEEAQTLFYKIDELYATHKPSPWREPLRQGAYTLSRYWKGTYAFLDHSEVQRLRKQGPGHEIYIDKNVDEGKIQSLELAFAQPAHLSNRRPLTWPALFESRLHSLLPSTSAQPLKTQARHCPKQSQNIQFEGTGQDLDDEYRALGWLNALPPQGGIPGWQRITFMKHFSDDYQDPDQDNLWAYEGVVMPGGRMILGRWWFASESMATQLDYNGPFILWAVDEPEMDGEEEEEEEE
ncbi:hypothetical protein COCVIDRAFT_38776 [Bipolaris victoriae FI3]|uniref:F-box domain-containing protein n=1 Tax=Bipolaris victoriae (strain FI3) TaxID=930091 RepID=W7ENA2_BIPV3|nr:hypothetical protein COCVIDRAFT_38776 [Bipolaris victoriae FI3]